MKRLRNAFTSLTRCHKFVFSVPLLFISSLLVSGCVTPISLDEQTPDVTYHPKSKTLISVIDQRHRVLGGESPALIGKAHGLFGIPANWYVTPVLSTEEEDEGKTLAEYLQHRIVAGLRNSHWEVQERTFSDMPDGNKVTSTLASEAAEFLMVFILREWYFSINLNWVTAFNFDTEVDISILDSSGRTLLDKKFKDRDVVDEEASQSPQNTILGAYREQLRQILLDGDIKSALTGTPLSLEPASTRALPATNKPAESRQLTPGQKSRLETMELLRDDGIFSEQEFEKQKQQILNERTK